MNALLEILTACICTGNVERTPVQLSVIESCPVEFLCAEEDVYHLLATIATSKSLGHDNISGRMLKETALSITPVITELFNQSIILGKLPNEWKVARVCPVPKSGKSSDPNNYRPISLLSILSKLLEKHIRNILVKHFEDKHPLSAQQWGFTSGKSTTGALLSATEHWHRELERRNDICTIFFDFSKAFDTVPHGKLLEKLHHYDVHPIIIRWVTSYLTRRRQYVCVNGSRSEIAPVSSGVPQGSVLGPLLFIVYVNDVTNIFLTAGSMVLYADDIALYRPILSSMDFELLQTDVNKLCIWTSQNTLRFNARKCKYMIISRKKKPLSPSLDLHIDGSPLERVTSYKYLGVLITSTLSWSPHITNVCKRARQQLGIVYRQFYQHANCDTMRQLYISNVRSHLEYAAPVWDPHFQYLLQQLKKVQKLSLKMCTKNWKADYEMLLTESTISNC